MQRQGAAVTVPAAAATLPRKWRESESGCTGRMSLRMYNLKNISRFRIRGARFLKSSAQALLQKAVSAFFRCQCQASVRKPVVSVRKRYHEVVSQSTILSFTAVPSNNGCLLLEILIISCVFFNLNVGN